MIIIINNGFGRGSFKGDPTGFVNLPVGSLFGRQYYRYWKKLPSRQWEPFTDLYYQPTRLEYENDSFGKIWFMSSNGWSYAGQFNPTGQKQQGVGPSPLPPILSISYFDTLNPVSNVTCGETLDRIDVESDYELNFTLSNTGEQNLEIDDIYIQGGNPTYTYLVFTGSIPHTLTPSESLGFSLVTNRENIINDFGNSTYTSPITIESNIGTCNISSDISFQVSTGSITVGLYYFPTEEGDMVQFNCGDNISSLLTVTSDPYTKRNVLRIINSGSSDLIIDNISIDDIDTNYVNMNLYDPVSEDFIYLDSFPFPVSIAPGEDNMFVFESLFDEERIVNELGEGPRSWNVNIESNSVDPLCSFEIGGNFVTGSSASSSFGIYYYDDNYDPVQFECGDSLIPPAERTDKGYTPFRILNNGEQDLQINELSINGGNTQYSYMYIYDSNLDQMVPSEEFTFPYNLPVGEQLYYEINFDESAIVNDFGVGIYSSEVDIDIQGLDACAYDIGYDFGQVEPLFTYNQTGFEWILPSSAGGQGFDVHGGSYSDGWALWIATSDTTRELVHYDENSSGGQTFDLSQYYNEPAVQNVSGSVKKFFLTYTLIGSGGGLPVAEMPSNIQITNYEGVEPTITNYFDMESKFLETGYEWVEVMTTYNSEPVRTCNDGQWIEVDINTTNVTIECVNACPTLPINPGFSDYTVPDYTGESVAGDFYGFDRSENSYYTSSLNWEPYGLIVQSDMSDNGKFIHSKFFDAVNSEYKTVFFEFDTELNTFVEREKLLSEDLTGWNADSGKRKLSRNGDLLTGCLSGSNGAYGFWKYGDTYPTKTWHIDETYEAKFLTTDGKFVFGTAFHESQTRVFVYNTETEEEFFVEFAEDVYMIPFSGNFFIGRENTSGNITKFVFNTSQYKWISEGRPFAIGGVNITPSNFVINDLSLNGNLMIGRTSSSPSAPIAWNLFDEPIDFKRESFDLPMSNPSEDHTPQAISSDGTIIIGTDTSTSMYWKIQYVDNSIDNMEGPIELQQVLFDRTNGTPQEFWNPSNPPPVDTYTINSTFQPVVGYSGRQLMFSGVKVFADGGLIRPSVGYIIPSTPLTEELPPVPPVNDNFDNAIEISYITCGEQIQLTGSNEYATRQIDEPYILPDSNPDYTYSTNSIWWKWTSPSDFNSTVTIDLMSSSFDTQLAIYTGSSLDSLEQIVWNDDVPLREDFTSMVSFSAQPNTTYHIQVDGYYGSTGSVIMDFSSVCPFVAESASLFAYQDQPALNNGTASVSATASYDIVNSRVVLEYTVRAKSSTQIAEATLNRSFVNHPTSGSTIATRTTIATGDQIITSTDYFPLATLQSQGYTDKFYFFGHAYIQNPQAVYNSASIASASISLPYP